MSDYLAGRIGPLLAPEGKHGGSVLAVIWRGSSPVRLLVRGVAQTAVSVFFAVLLSKLVSGEFAELTDQAGGTVWWTVLIGFVLLCAALGLLKAGVGLLDLILGRQVRGTVVSTRERRTGDRLPWVVQPMISRWGQPGAIGDAQRPWFVPSIRRWHEVVITHPEEGSVRWTASLAQANKLREDNEVELRVGPLLGHISAVRVLDRD